MPQSGHNRWRQSNRLLVILFERASWAAEVSNVCRLVLAIRSSSKVFAGRASVTAISMSFSAMFTWYSCAVFVICCWRMERVNLPIIDCQSAVQGVARVGVLRFEFTICLFCFLVSPALRTTKCQRGKSWAFACNKSTLALCCVTLPIAPECCFPGVIDAILKFQEEVGFSGRKAPLRTEWL